MKAIFILMDSLNRHYLPAYGNDWVQTPNIDRFARKSVTFDNHWLGSAPCMPARRDMMTGRLNFLERGWSGIEPYDVLLQEELHKAGIHTHCETDHYHYFCGGGEFYHTTFTTWNTWRGQEFDPMPGPIPNPDTPEHLGKWSLQYAKNQTHFKTDADFPSPRTFQGAIDWLAQNEDADNYFLWVEAFDPHEPFDASEEFRQLYADDWEGPLYNWSAYDRVDEYPEGSTAHLQREYAACLSMNDKWFGKLLDEVERQGAYEDTLIVLTTDHGHFLGERNRTGKNCWHCWNELAHIPLIVHVPGSKHAGERRTQLTQNIDLMPTLMEYFNVPLKHAIHGHSMVDYLQDANAPSKRSAALFGWYASPVNVTNGRHVYMRASKSPENTPLYEYFQMPTTFHRRFRKEMFDDVELGRFLPHVDTNVLRREFRSPLDPENERVTTQLFDIESDYAQQDNLCGKDDDLEEEMCKRLIQAMKDADSPVSQFERLGLDASV